MVCWSIGKDISLPLLLSGEFRLGNNFLKVINENFTIIYPLDPALIFRPEFVSDHPPEHPYMAIFVIYLLYTSITINIL